MGTTIQINGAIEDAISGKSGVRVLRNSQGTDMLSGYASVPISGWGVVAQRPLKVTLAQLNDTILSVLKSTLPVTILTLLLILVFGSKIAKPLWKLAVGVRAMDRYAQSNVQKIDAWYFEAEHLKQAIVSGTELVGKTIQEYDLDRQKDPLTQLLNRRGMLAKLEYFQSIKKPYSVIALDIDHFKRINDKFGHDVGDQVIRTLAELMQSSAREQDVICRTGGEEFAIFLPNVDIGQAVSIAERLRVDVSNHLFPPVAKVNISLGVAYSSRTECNFHQVLKNADKALYDAKHGGRNRTAVTDCEAA